MREIVYSFNKVSEVIKEDEIPSSPFFTEEEEDYIVRQYGLQGFRNSAWSAASSEFVSNFDFVDMQLCSFTQRRSGILRLV